MREEVSILPWLVGLPAAQQTGSALGPVTADRTHQTLTAAPWPQPAHVGEPHGLTSLQPARSGQSLLAALLSSTAVLLLALLPTPTWQIRVAAAGPAGQGQCHGRRPMLG